ncbi:MAG: RNA methyltransferase [Lachnospiraceae bacterium]|jgi:TrmH family RNA methyltransferase|nr:RNA methyltransferase [Lachnospiraceae bacterium]MCI1328245.1 RNA methyltransferase [Lachnospiraceae bacterium]
MITSSSSAKLKMIQQLNTKAKARRESGCFVLEGRKLFEETPDSLRRGVFMSESFARENPEMAEAILNDTCAEVVSDRLFSSVCDTKTPQGILTVAAIPRWNFEDLTAGARAPLVMVLENVQDPGNVGTIIRTGEGAGVTGILLGEGCADIYSPKVIRATMGSIFRVPAVRERDLAGALRRLGERGVRSYAAHLNGTNEYTEEHYKTGTAFLIGSEGNGLSAGLTEEADCLIRIPMEGRVESLNASVAASLLMYEARRQRN